MRGMHFAESRPSQSGPTGKLHSSTRVQCVRIYSADCCYRVLNLQKLNLFVLKLSVPTCCGASKSLLTGEVSLVSSFFFFLSLCLEMSTLCRRYLYNSRQSSGYQESSIRTSRCWLGGILTGLRLAYMPLFLVKNLGHICPALRRDWVERPVISVAI